MMITFPVLDGLDDHEDAGVLVVGHPGAPLPAIRPCTTTSSLPHHLTVALHRSWYRQPPPPPTRVSSLVCVLLSFIKRYWHFYELSLSHLTAALHRSWYRHPFPSHPPPHPHTRGYSLVRVLPNSNKTMLAFLCIIRPSFASLNLATNQTT